jgi:hypothetical protein
MFSFADWLPKSDAEKQVDALYGGMGPATSAPEPTARLQLSTWDKIKIAVTPISYGESVVNQIYGPDGPRGIGPDPSYTVTDFSMPQNVIAAKNAASRILGSVGASLQGGFVKLALIVGAFLLVAIFVNAFARR